MIRVELMFKIHSEPACTLHTKRIPYKNTPQLTTLTHFLFGPPLSRDPGLPDFIRERSVGSSPGTAANRP